MKLQRRRAEKARCQWRREAAVLREAAWPCDAASATKAGVWGSMSMFSRLG